MTSLMRPPQPNGHYGKFGLQEIHIPAKKTHLLPSLPDTLQVTIQNSLRHISLNLSVQMMMYYYNTYSPILMPVTKLQLTILHSSITYITTEKKNKMHEIQGTLQVWQGYRSSRYSI